MAGWGEEFDEELKNQEEIEVGFRFGFKGMSFLIDRIVEETREWDDKHPKDDLRFIFFTDTYLYNWGRLGNVLNIPWDNTGY